MKKSRKYSKGISSGFVPESRHSVKTERFRSSMRVDNEIIAAANSPAPKRKCISLNGCDNFGAYEEVLSVSKMTRSEREDLKLKWKMELEQLRTIQKKLSVTGPLIPSGNINSYDVGLKGASLKNFKGSSEVSDSKGKKVPNGTHNKRSNSGGFEPGKPAAAVSASNTVLVKQCETLLNCLMSHKYGWVFNTPVDTVKLNIPDYFSVIKHPMDLGTVKHNLLMGRYENLVDFAADVRLTFLNAVTYNPAGNDVHFMANSLSKYFEVRWKAIEMKLPSTIDVPSRVQMSSEACLGLLHSTDEQITRDDFDGQSDSDRKIMSNEEKHKISLELESLSADLPQSIIAFLKEHISCSDPNSEEEIEIDIYALSDDTLFALGKLLDVYFLEQNTQQKAESLNLKHPNESGYHDPSVEAIEGNDPIDEEVDIVGGNDQRVTTHLPPEIENVVAHQHSIDTASCTSSSGDSGSSSSDSGSGSSSDSGSIDANITSPSCPTKIQKMELV